MKNKIEQYVKDNPNVDALDIAIRFDISLPKAVGIVQDFLDKGTFVIGDYEKREGEDE